MRRSVVPLIALILAVTALWGLAQALDLYAPEPAEPVHRMPDQQVLLEQETFVIAAFGTSLTARNDWPERLAGALSACSGRLVSVERVARAGANSTWGREQVDRVLALKPDLVLVEFAINDADLRDGLSLSQAKNNHMALIDALQTGRPGVPLVLMTMNRAEGLRGLMRPWLGAHYAQYRTLAMERGLGLVDLAPLWAAALAKGQGSVLLPDGLHPTDTAVAEVAFPTLLARIGALLPNCA